MIGTLLEVVGALATGVALGLLGGGGSILTVPIFVYAAGLEPKLAVAASLPVVTLTSAAAAIAHWRQGNVRVRTALIFGATAAVGSFASARAASRVSGVVQLTLLAVVMLVAASRMIAASAPAFDEANANFQIAYGKLIPVALGVGLLTGLVGVGGGFLIVPTLVLLCHLPMRAAVGTSLMVIAMNTASATAGYVGHVDIPWQTVLLFSAVAIFGSLLGSKLSAHVPQNALRRGFGVLLIALAVFILVQNRHVFTSLLPS